MEIVGFKDFWKQNKMNESTEYVGSTLEEIADQFEDDMNGAFGSIKYVGYDRKSEYGLDNNGTPISLFNNVEFGPYYVAYGVYSKDNDLQFSITYSVNDKTTEDMIDDLKGMGYVVHENTIEKVGEDDSDTYTISGNVHIFIKVDFEQIFKDIVAKLKPTVHNITPEQLSMQWGEWVLPEDTSGYVITKVLSKDSQDILNKICNQYSLKWSEQEKGYVLIEPK